MKDSSKIAVLSDIHSNLEALNVVLKEIVKRNINKIFFLGDVVGYGPDPDICVEIVSQNCQEVVAGNHDWAVIGLTPLEYFNHDARLAAEWTRDKIKKDTLDFLKKMKIKSILKEDDIILVHSTPKEPEAWNYIFTLFDAEVNFHYFEEKICLIGHSHKPFIIERLPTGELVVHKEKVNFKKFCRYIINVGSVGQPRDADPRAAFAILSEENVEIIRIEYDYNITQQKMRKEGLPEFLIQRLAKGI